MHQIIGLHHHSGVEVSAIHVVQDRGRLRVLVDTAMLKRLSCHLAAQELSGLVGQYEDVSHVTTLVDWVLT